MTLSLSEDRSRHREERMAFESEKTKFYDQLQQIEKEKKYCLSLFPTVIFDRTRQLTEHGDHIKAQIEELKQLEKSAQDIRKQHKLVKYWLILDIMQQKEMIVAAEKKVTESETKLREDETKLKDAMDALESLKVRLESGRSAWLLT